MEIGDILNLKVKKITYAGVVLEYQQEEILVPFDEQKDEMKVGNEYLVIIYGKTADKYFASEKIGFQLHEEVEEGVFEKGQEIEGIVYAFSPLGIKVALRNKYSGLLYKNEVFQDLKIGEKLKVYIKNIRDDRKIELVIQKPGYKNMIIDATDTILHELKRADGFLPLNDKSDPEDIKNKLHMSKKNFKQAIGALYKQKAIDIMENGIRLLKKDA